MLWNHVVPTIQEISATISILGNLLLIILILTKSPRQLGSYKYLMIYISVFEISFSLIDLIVRPIMFSHGSIFICISTNFFIRKDVGIFLLSIWSGFFGSFMVLFALQFIYRYLVACKSKTLKTFNDKRIILWMMLPASVGIFWGSVVYIFIHPNYTIDKDMKSTVKEELNRDITNVAYVGPNLYKLLENGKMRLNERSLVAVVIVWSLVNISMFTVTFFAIKCYLRINSKFEGSTKLNHLQHQLFYALVSQTLIPFILMHFPVSILLFSTAFNFDLGVSSSLVAVSTAIFPALDPLPVILIIKNYRNAVADVFTNRVFTQPSRERNSNRYIQGNREQRNQETTKF